MVRTLRIGSGPAASAAARRRREIAWMKTSARATRSRVRLASGSSTTTRPSLMMTTLSQTCSTSGRMCVERTTVRFAPRPWMKRAASRDLAAGRGRWWARRGSAPRVVDERLRQADALAVALREVAEEAVRDVAEPAGVEHAIERGADVAPADALQAGRRSAGTGRPSCRCRAAGSPAGSRCGGAPRRDCSKTSKPLDLHRAGRGRQEAGDDAHASWSSRRRSDRGSRGSVPDAAVNETSWTAVRSPYRLLRCATSIM